MATTNSNAYINLIVKLGLDDQLSGNFKNVVNQLNQSIRGTFDNVQSLNLGLGGNGGNGLNTGTPGSLGKGGNVFGGGDLNFKSILGNAASKAFKAVADIMIENFDKVWAEIYKKIESTEIKNQKTAVLYGALGELSGSGGKALEKVNSFIGGNFSIQALGKGLATDYGELREIATMIVNLLDTKDEFKTQNTETQYELFKTIFAQFATASKAGIYQGGLREQFSAYSSEILQAQYKNEVYGVDENGKRVLKNLNNFKENTSKMLKELSEMVENLGGDGKRLQDIHRQIIKRTSHLEKQGGLFGVLEAAKIGVDEFQDPGAYVINMHKVAENAPSIFQYKTGEGFKFKSSQYYLDAFNAKQREQGKNYISIDDAQGFTGEQAIDVLLEAYEYKRKKISETNNSEKWKKIALQKEENRFKDFSIQELKGYNEILEGRVTPSEYLKIISKVIKDQKNHNADNLNPSKWTTFDSVNIGKSANDVSFYKEIAEGLGAYNNQYIKTLGTHGKKAIANIMAEISKEGADGLSPIEREIKSKKSTYGLPKINSENIEGLEYSIGGEVAAYFANSKNGLSKYAGSVLLNKLGDSVYSDKGFIRLMEKLSPSTFKQYGANGIASLSQEEKKKQLKEALGARLSEDEELNGIIRANAKKYGINENFEALYSSKSGREKLKSIGLGYSGLDLLSSGLLSYTSKEGNEYSERVALMLGVKREMAYEENRLENLLSFPKYKQNNTSIKQHKKRIKELQEELELYRDGNVSIFNHGNKDKLILPEERKSYAELSTGVVRELNQYLNQANQKEQIQELKQMNQTSEKTLEILKNTLKANEETNKKLKTLEETLTLLDRLNKGKINISLGNI